jgi:two-component system KDP operon response regulator KdpE
MDKKRILIVDDDPAILRLLSTNLKARGYEVTTATDGEEALEAVQKDFIDLMILDLMMPKIDGIEVCRRIREWSDIPIIILSARGDENDKVKCLELGADDYLTKPFGIAELMARINTAFRHRGDAAVAPAQASFTCDGLEINFAKRRVTVNGREIALTPTEYSLLQQLAVNSDKVLTHTMLLQTVWGNEYSSEKEYLRVFVGRLRKKLEPNPKNPRYIQTIPGVGYHLSLS